MSEKLSRETHFESQQEEINMSQLLQKIQEEELSALKEAYSEEDLAENIDINAVRTLFGHSLIGSSMHGQGILDKDVPIAILVGADRGVVRRKRQEYFEKDKGIFIGPHNVEQDGRNACYEITLALKDLTEAVTLDNIDFKGTRIVEDGSKKFVNETEKKEKIVKYIFLKKEAGWQRAKERCVKNRQNQESKE